MEERAIDRNRDGFIDSVVYDAMTDPCYLNPESCGRSWYVFVDASSSSGEPPLTYDLRVVGDLGTCEHSETVFPWLFRCSFPRQDAYVLTLIVTDFSGVQSAPFEELVTVRDLLIVSIGDSVASGEGNPDVPLPSLMWQDGRCHRSAKAGTAQAARALETADAHSSVTFLHLACSGATIPAGLIGGYNGKEPCYGVPEGVGCAYSNLPPQVDEVARRLCPVDLDPDRDRYVNGRCPDAAGGRAIDALLISVGANDIHFGDAATICAVINYCWDPADITAFGKGWHLDVPGMVQSGLDDLPSAYDALNKSIRDKLSFRGPESLRRPIFITEYFDPTGSDEATWCDLLTRIEDAAEDMLPTGFGWLTDVGELHPRIDFEGILASEYETQWAFWNMLVPLNSAVGRAASVHGWNAVYGIAGDFFYHGLCANAFPARDHWIVRLFESKDSQGNFDGVLHPNLAGHNDIRDRLVAKLINRLFNNGPPDFEVHTALGPLPSAFGRPTPGLELFIGSLLGENDWLTGFCGFRPWAVTPDGHQLFRYGCESDSVQVEVRAEDPEGIVHRSCPGGPPCTPLTPSISMGGIRAEYTGPEIVGSQASFDFTLAPGLTGQYIMSMTDSQSVVWRLVATADGIYTLEFQATDSALFPGTFTYTLKVDLHDPTASASVAGTAGSGDWFTSSVVVTLEGADGEIPFAGSGMAALEYSVDGGVTAVLSPLSDVRGPPSLETDVAVSGEGVHTLAYQSVDVAGRRGPLQSLVVNIDSTPPQTSVVSATDGNGAALAEGGTTLFEPARIEFAGEDATSGVASFQCSLDGGAFSECSSPFSGGFDLGSHVFQVRALDSAGNVDPTPAVFTWTLLTPSEAARNLVDAVAGMDLPSNIEKPLLGVLVRVPDVLGDNNPTNDAGVCERLAVFINMVNNYEAKGALAGGQAAQLRLLATNIRIKMGCT